MKILFVVHRYLPDGHGGSEVYTQGIATALAERHEVAVFTACKDPTAPDLVVRERREGPVQVVELVNNLFLDDFRQTYDHPAIDRAFTRTMEAIRPDVVHFMHLLNLSFGCVREAARRGAAIFFHLHDFWFQCARAQRLHPEGTVCDELIPSRCASCIAALPFAMPPAERRAARVLRRLRSGLGIDLKRLARAVNARIARPRPFFDAGPEAAARAHERLVERRDRVLREIEPAVRLFFAPSRFLRGEFVRWGLPATKVVTRPYGVDLTPFRGFRRTSSPRLRFAFVGSLTRHKGPHVLLEAWSRVREREHASLRLFGSDRPDPAYGRFVRALARRSGAVVEKPFPRASIASVFSEIDCLVVPSLWYENSPIVLLEARATGTPALVSDLGGMAEAVESGVSGYRFPPGDASALADQIERAMRDPARLGALRPASVRVTPIEEDAAGLEELYREAQPGNAGAVASRPRPARGDLAPLP